MTGKGKIVVVPLDPYRESPFFLLLALVVHALSS